MLTQRRAKPVDDAVYGDPVRVGRERQRHPMLLRTGGASVTTSSIDGQNALQQSARPGGEHQRLHTGARALRDDGESTDRRVRSDVRHGPVSLRPLLNRRRGAIAPDAARRLVRPLLEPVLVFRPRRRWWRSAAALFDASSGYPTSICSRKGRAELPAADRCLQVPGTSGQSMERLRQIVILTGNRYLVFPHSQQCRTGSSGLPG